MALFSVCLIKTHFFLNDWLTWQDQEAHMQSSRYALFELFFLLSLQLQF